MGIYTTTASGGMSSYREASEIYLNNGEPIILYDDVNGDGMFGYQGKIEKIEAKARAPQLLDIRLSINDGDDTYIREILHCGAFTIVWE